MSKYKLIVFDLDDTLLDKQKRIDLKVLTTIQRMRNKGFLISSISGRNHSMMDLYNKQMHIDSFASCNGSLIYINNNLVFESKISSETINNLYYLCHRYNLYFCLFGIFDGYYCREVPCINNARNYNGLAQSFARQIDIKYDEQYCDSNIYKFMIYIDRRKASIEKMFEEINRIDDLSVSIAGGYIEITNSNANKGNALKRIGKELKVKRNEIVYFGDSLSDYSALEYADYSVCMKSSPDELKGLAKDVAADNKDINRILLNIERG